MSKPGKAGRRTSQRSIAALLGALLTAVGFFLLLFLTDWSLYFAWLLPINLTTFILFGVDKALAKADQARIPEKVLHIFTLLGGFLGQFAGRLVFHHKSNFGRHPSFTTIPLISLALWAAIGYLLLR